MTDLDDQLVKAIETETTSTNRAFDMLEPEMRETHGRV